MQLKFPSLEVSYKIPICRAGWEVIKGIYIPPYFRMARTERTLLNFWKETPLHTHPVLHQNYALDPTDGH